MLFWLYSHLIGPLGSRSLMLRTLLATLVAFALVLALGGPVIAWLRRRKIGDNPDFDRADMNAIMADKRGTPTMGGLLIIGSIVATTLLVADVANLHVWLALATTLVLAGLGATDDWIKLNRHRRAAAGTSAATRQGLTGRQKLVVQIALGAIVALALGDGGPRVVPFLDASIALPRWLFVLWATFVVTAVSNSVNLTDGLDGLASGCVASVALVLVAFGIVAGDADLARTLDLPFLPIAAEVAVIAGAIGGACLGFLWFNAHPARVFMGDTGSLALGGLLAYVALAIRQELLLAIIGAVFVAEALSVMLQVYYFKYTRIRFGEGRRIFRMSPLHHHFQKLGWSESQVVVRFWLVAAMLAVVGLASMKLR